MTDDEIKEWLESQYDLNENGCWVWKGSKNLKGYGKIQWKGTTRGIHRLYWLLSGRTIPEGLQMCHGPGCSKACYNLEHLKPGTQSENMIDKIRDGTDSRGEKHVNAKLTAEQVLAIRANVENKTCRELGEEYGVDNTLISRIILRKAWKHI